MHLAAGTATSKTRVKLGSLTPLVLESETLRCKRIKIRGNSALLLSCLTKSNDISLPVSQTISTSSSFSFIELYTVTNEWFRKAIYAEQYRSMAFKIEVSRTKMIYVVFQFVLLRSTIINLTKHWCIHVTNFVRKKPHKRATKFIIFIRHERGYLCKTFQLKNMLRLKTGTF